MKLINGLRAEQMQQMTTATAAAAALDSVPVQTDISACGRAAKSLVFISRTDGQKCARIDRGGGGTVLCNYIKSPPGIQLYGAKFSRVG